LSLDEATSSAVLQFSERGTATTRASTSAKLLLLLLLLFMVIVGSVGLVYDKEVGYSLYPVYLVRYCRAHCLDYCSRDLIISRDLSYSSRLLT
jgi:hypothetical protein